jgi:hypothetical protein
VVQNYGAIIREFLDAAKGSQVTGDEFCGFLCAFDFCALDLGRSGSRAESLLSRLTDSCGSVTDALATWAR